MYIKSHTKKTFEDYTSIFAIFIIFASLTYQIALCFTNTHVFGVSKGAVVLVEFVLIISGFCLFAKKMDEGFLLFLVFLLINALFLSLFKGQFNPKDVRDFLIPVLMLWLGFNYNKKVEVDRIVKYCAYLVIGVGLFEAAFSTQYQSLFNIAHYHRAIGLIAENYNDYREDGLSLNGLRYGGRNFLSFLGNHRISSVFLETVSMGNFGVVIACWGLAKDKKEVKDICFILGLGLVIALLADSRFGLTMIIGLAFLRFVLSINVLRISSYFFPLLIITITLCIYEFSYVTFTDDFKGRLGFTGYNLAHFSIIEYLGLSGIPKYYGDSGYSNGIINYGLIFCILAWTALCRLKPTSPQGIRYASLITIFIAAILAISGSSIFAMKVTVLMWFLIGVTLQKESAQ